jgi:hypothetical protein
VKALREELAHDESRYFYLDSMTKVISVFNYIDITYGNKLFLEHKGFKISVKGY